MYACTSNSEESIKYLLKKKMGMGGAGEGKVGILYRMMQHCVLLQITLHTQLDAFL